MSRILKRKYRARRKAMKAELAELMKGNMTLVLLVRDTYIAHHQRYMLHEIWYTLGTRYRDIYIKEFCGTGGLTGKMKCGRFDEIFNTMYFIDKDFYMKHKGIPECYALGDAYAVAMRYMRAYETNNRQAK